uniref:Uncharacterized protein n=1 Tax=Anguilla anguilla TaxID=7936 RepID=A0A0E9TBG2_ANGAN
MFQPTQSISNPMLTLSWIFPVL